MLKEMILNIFGASEPVVYPKGSMESAKIVEYVLANRDGLKEFSRTMGSLSLPFTRTGVENDRLRYFNEFGGMGSFSYLIINGCDVIDCLDRDIWVSTLVNEGVLKRSKPVRSLLQRWGGCL